MNRKILFYAPVGNLIAGFQNGGAEAGCRKTIEILSKAGYELILLEKPAKKEHVAAESILLLANLIKAWFSFVSILRKHSGITVHIAGFYLNQIYFEWILIRTARLMGVKTIYEVRNGGMIEAYKAGSSIYRYFMKSTLSGASQILCQGHDYLSFIKQTLNRDSIYYPNYLMDDFVTSNETLREQQQELRLIYFGRVVPDKNVDFIIEVCRELHRAGMNFTLDIIGGYEQSYFKKLTDDIKAGKLEKNVVFHGRKSFSEIYDHLKSSHFFIFPSKEKREGHSNSLTEAMGCGVVPIVSPAGFNASIVGNPTLVMHEFNSSAYADKIVEIWNSQGLWKVLSDQVYKRIVENYTESIVKQALLQAYKNAQ